MRTRKTALFVLIVLAVIGVFVGVAVAVEDDMGRATPTEEVRPDEAADHEDDEESTHEDDEESTHEDEESDHEEDDEFGPPEETGRPDGEGDESDHEDDEGEPQGEGGATVDEGAAARDGEQHRYQYTERQRIGEPQARLNGKVQTRGVETRPNAKDETSQPKAPKASGSGRGR